MTKCNITHRTWALLSQNQVLFRYRLAIPVARASQYRVSVWRHVLIWYVYASCWLFVLTSTKQTFSLFKNPPSRDNAQILSKDIHFYPSYDTFISSHRIRKLKCYCGQHNIWTSITYVTYNGCVGWANTTFFPKFLQSIYLPHSKSWATFSHIL